MMVTQASCDRCGAKSENPGSDNWKQVRVYPIGAVFEICRQCGADTLEFIRTAPKGSPRALGATVPEPPPEKVEFLDEMRPGRAARIRHAQETGGDVAAACEDAAGKTAAATKLADDIIDQSRPKKTTKKPAAARVVPKRVR